MANDHSRAELSSNVALLNAQIERLQKELRQVKQEKIDLEVMLNTITSHSDQILLDVEQEKTDLEILLETATEHSTLIENDLQNQVEEERRQREQQFQLITAATPVGLIISRVTDSQILYANEAIARMIGIAAEELIHYRTLDFYVHPNERLLVLDRVAAEQRFQDELLFKRADGSTFWALVSLCPFVFQGASTFLTSIADISDRKQAEEALRIAEAKFRGIFENAVEGIFQSSTDGRYLDVNPAMAAMFGYDSPESMLREVSDISHQIYVNSELREEFVRSLLQHNEIKDFEYQVYHRKGHIFWVSEWARGIRNESGELLYYEGSCVDITKRKQEEESLRERIRILQIQIDQSQVQKEVAEIEQTDYFQWLMAEADNLRNSEG